MKRTLVAAVVLIAGACAPALADDAAEQEARWRDVASTIFGERGFEDGSAILSMKIPERTMDAALVPVTIDIAGTQPLKSVSLIIDNNPAPLAGTFRFGPAFVQKTLKMRVRINEYTQVHAVAEADDGKLYMISKFVKAAGGCSAPSAVASQETLDRMGHMQLRRERALDPGSVPAQLMISHPNFSGMQRDAKTGDYTPARYLETVTVSVGGAKAFDLETGISMSEDPAISFAYRPQGDGAIEVKANDSSSAKFARRFEPLN